MDVLIKEIVEKSKEKAEEYLNKKNINGEIEILLFPEDNEAILRVFIPTLPKTLQWKTRYYLNKIVTRTTEECAGKNFRNFYEARSRISISMTIGVSK